jgi:hypothetical protein
MTNMEQNDKPISVAIVCLDSAVPMYADTLSFISWKLRRENIDVARIGCAGVLDTCTSINSTGKSALSGNERDRICQRCRAGQQELGSQSVFEVSDEDGINSEDAQHYLDELKKRITTTGSVVAVLDLDYAGLPLCRMAFFDFSIVTKLKPDSILDDQSANRFVAGVRDLIKLHHAFERFRMQHEVSHIVYVNGNYTQNTLVRHIFGANGVICLSVEPQLTSQHVLNRVMLAPDRLSLHPNGLFRSEINHLSLNANNISDVQNVLKNFGARIEGSDFNVYTSLDGQAITGEEIQRLRKFLSTYKKINSFFLSSEDELTPHIITHGAPVVPNPNLLGPYRTQLEFTAYLLQEAASHPEVGFIIRLHPRMAVNKRDHFESEEHVRYKNMLSGGAVPENVFVLYGDCKISSYFIISKSDLVIISWSTIGLEALLLGVPVISAFPYYLMYPLSMLTRQPINQAELEEALFGNSNFGIPDGNKLLVWISMAFEGQFFATAAPRGRGGLLGKYYLKAYNLSKITGVYGFLAWVINFLFLRQVKLNQGLLLLEQKIYSPDTEIANRTSSELLEKYRTTYRHLLDEYGQRINGVH